MKKRSKIFILLVIGALALVALGLEMLMHPQLKYVLTQPGSYSECLDAGGAILETFPAQCKYGDQTFTDPAQGGDAEPASKTKAYQDTVNGYSFEYPGDVFTQTEGQQQFPFLNRTDLRQAVTLTHEVRLPHCSLADETAEACDPTTTDITITFMPVDQNVNDVMNTAKSALGTDLEDIKLNPTINAKITEVGAEGEGRFYYITPLDNNKTLLIIRSYIREDVIGSYQNKPDFTPFAQQEQIFKDVAATLKLTSSTPTPDQSTSSLGPDLGSKLTSDTSNWETFSNNTRGYSIKYPKDWILETVNQDTNPLDGKPLRFLKFTSPNKRYLMIVGIKKSNEADIKLFDRSGTAAGDLVPSGKLMVAGTPLTLNALTYQGNISDIFYGSGAGSDATIRDYVIYSEFDRLEGNISLDQAPELAIANSILASLTLTK